MKTMIRKLTTFLTQNIKPGRLRWRQTLLIFPQARKRYASIDMTTVALHPKTKHRP